jgi:hypothetical protein
MDRAMTGAQAAARGLSVVVFLAAALIAFFGALIHDAEETYITWSSPTVLGLLAFGGANVAAAGLAALGGRSVTLRIAGALSLIPAVLLMNEHAGGSSGSRWLLLAGAVALVIGGGAVAGLRR